MLIKKILWDAPLQALDKFLEIKGFFLAQAIAFKSLITVIPVILFGLGLLAQYFQSPENLELVSGLISELVPAYLDEFILFFQDFQGGPSNITLIGAIGTLVFATVLMNTLCIVVSEVFAGEHHKSRKFLKQYLFSFQLALQVGGIFILTVLLSLFVQTLNAAGLSFITELGIDKVWIQSGWRRMINLLGVLIPFVLSSAMFFQLFYLIPTPHPPVRSVLLGTMTATVFWEAAKSLFTIYATNFAFFNRFRDNVVFGLEDLSNTVGLIIAFMVWVYYSGIVLIIGSIVVMLDEKRRLS